MCICIQAFISMSNYNHTDSETLFWNLEQEKATDSTDNIDIFFSYWPGYLPKQRAG